jgi:hypothetical protein
MCCCCGTIQAIKVGKMDVSLHSFEAVTTEFLLVNCCLNLKVKGDMLLEQVSVEMFCQVEAFQVCGQPPVIVLVFPLCLISSYCVGTSTCGVSEQCATMSFHI